MICLSQALCRPSPAVRTATKVTQAVLPTIRRHSNSARHQPSAMHFYQNRQLELYASKEAKRLTLRQLVCLKHTSSIVMKWQELDAGVFRSFHESRSPHKSNPLYVYWLNWNLTFFHLKSANYVRTELPVRIAHRLRDLQSLPYVVVTQEGVAKVYEVCFSLKLMKCKL